ncbi:Bax inhibitor-1/YccA family protein [Kineococcus rhizosphaerae]|uniref:Putative YccA/Bax inhibitor family protein n=1 Tax=Kineococcus rhizosphaerae TaxID=559628 RepID=A0A2T0R4D8_9ACTN|nr:Bax inhibitor-1/YccA family protein [Kineococcus rhizosphaerae]PRY15237.1 putative YccA/Bax inhibitor family protein [Kineococcus rhizosphaerae]
MESKNPVFARSNEWKRNGYATFDAPGSAQRQRQRPADASARTLEDWYTKPSATPAQSRRMTLDDVVVRTGSLFAVLLVGAAAGYLGVTRAGMGFGAVIVPALVAMVLGLWAQLSKKVRPGVMFAYAALEGVFVGGISAFYASLYDGIIGQAVLGTLAAFAGMLLAYKTGVVRNSPRFTKVLLIAGIGYGVFMLANLASSLIGWGNVYAGGGALAILVSAFGVVLASLFLVLDFDHIEQGIRNGLPVKESWRAGFGLMVTLVWLYLEILRLIAILRGND